jgi:hypothetical protein
LNEGLARIFGTAGFGYERLREGLAWRAYRVWMHRIPHVRVSRLLPGRVAALGACCALARVLMCSHDTVVSGGRTDARFERQTRAKESWRRAGERGRVRVRIVAVLGDANLLTARRSTAARSAKQPSLLLARSRGNCRGGALDNCVARRAGWDLRWASAFSGLLLCGLTIELTCVRRLA